MPHTHDLLPEPVGDRPRELPVGPADHPGGELLAAVGVADAGRHRSPEQLRPHRLERLRVVILVVVRQFQRRGVVAHRGGVGLDELHERPGLLPLRVAGLFDERAHRKGRHRLRFFARLPGPQRPAEPRPRAGREGRQLVKLVLRPVVERVIVALGAADLRAQQHADGVVHVGQRHAVVAELEADGGILPEAAVGGEHLVHPLVVRFVGADRVLDPGEVGLEHQVPLGPLGEPEDVGPVVVEVADVVGTRQQPLDDGVALAGRGVAKKRHRLLVGRDPAGELEVDTANELGVVEGRRRLDTVLPPAGGEMRVDRGGLRLHAAAAVGGDAGHRHHGFFSHGRHRRRQTGPRGDPLRLRPVGPQARTGDGHRHGWPRHAHTPGGSSSHHRGTTKGFFWLRTSAAASFRSSAPRWSPRHRRSRRVSGSASQPCRAPRPSFRP